MLSKNLFDAQTLDTDVGGEVVLLLLGEGTDGSNVIVDSSGKNHQLTAKGNSRISTANKRFGNSSLYFDGNNSGFYTEYSADFAMGLGDFTVEAWMYMLPQPDPYPRIVNFGNYWHSSNNFTITSRSNDTGKIDIGKYDTNATLGSSTAPSQYNTWYHVAVVRESGVFKLFVDGILESTNSNFINLPLETAQTNIVCIGGAYDNSSDSDFCGYIDEVRITKGLARYSSNFTPKSLVA